MASAGDLHRWTFKERHEKARREAIENGLPADVVAVYPIFPDEQVGKRMYRRMDRTILRVQMAALKELRELGMRTSTVEALVAGFMAELVDAKRAEAGKEPRDWDWGALMGSFKRSQTDPQYVEGRGARPPMRRKTITSAGVPLELVPLKEEKK